MTPRTRFFIVAGIVLLFVGTVATAVYCLVSYAQGQALNARAYRELTAENFDSAIGLYDRASRKMLDRTTRALVFGNRGWCYTKKENDSQAIRDFTESIRLDPRPLYSVLDRGLAYYRTGEFDKALTDLETALTKDPNVTDAHYRRAVIFFWKGDWDLAIAEYNEAIRCEPKNPQFFVERGLAYTANDQLDDAIASFDSALLLNPILPTAHVNRAKAYELKGDPARGIADISAAIAVRPDAALLVAARAYVYLDRGQIQEAAPDIAEAMRLAPNSEIPYLLRGWSAALDRNWPEVVLQAGKAVELAPRLAYAHYLLGRGLTGQGKPDEAIAEFDQALRYDPGSAWALFFRAQNYAYRQEYSRARDELRRAVERFPKSSVAHLGYGWFLATSPHDAYRDGDEAVAEALKSCELSRWTEYAAIGVLGAAYAEKGDFENAINFTEFALTLPHIAPKERATFEWRLGRYQMGLAIRDIGGGEPRRTLFEEGVSAYAQQKYERALQCFNRILPPNPGASVSAALFHFFAGTYDEKFRPPWAPEETAEMTNAFYYRGLIHQRRRRWDNAIADFSATIWRDRTSRLARAERSVCHQHKGDRESAFRDVDEMLRVKPDDALALALRADFLQMNGEPDKAAETAANALRLDSKLALAHAVRGRIFAARNENDLADREFAEAERLDPDHVAAIVQGAYELERMHDYEMAEAGYREAVTRFPRSALAHNNFAWFLATCPEAARRNGRKAVDHAKRACELSNWENGGDIDTLAAALAEAGDFDEALRYGNDALKKVKTPGERKDVEEHLLAFREQKPWREKR